MKQHILTAFLTGLVFIIFCLVPTQACAKRVALVIGNGSYEVAPLRNPVNDANDMAALLGNLGFEVILRTDADRRAMIEAIDIFGRKLPQSKIGLLYFAGHGMQIRGRNYLIPVRAQVSSETDVELESVDVYRVLGRMESAGNPANVIILDACRDNPFERSFRTSAQGLAKVDAPAGSLIAFATSPGGVAADGTGRNGIFTKHLLQNLSRAELSLTQALMETRRAVAMETGRNQVPWESSSLMQDVFFASSPAITSDVDDLAAQRARLEAEIAAQQERLELAKLTELEEQRLRLEAELREMERQREVERDDARPEQTGRKAGDTWTEPHTGMEFVWVPGGCFEMGCGPWTDQCYDREKPVHEVCVNGFWMGRHEVTNRQFRLFRSGHNSGDYKGNTLNRDDQPVVRVSWNDARDYAQWLSNKTGQTFRLPTEAEWEYAARGGTTTARYWGESPDDACRYANVADRTAKAKGTNWGDIHNCDDGHAVAAPVGSFIPNRFGLYDMLGNVWEWCEDVFVSDAYSQSGRDKNPVVTGGGSDRVSRGGSWDNASRLVRAANRFGNDPDYRLYYLGFRLLRTD